MYTSDLSIEKCLTVKFQVNMQPVVAFVGGIQFDLLPGPLAEVDTTVGSLKGSDSPVSFMSFFQPAQPSFSFAGCCA